MVKLLPVTGNEAEVREQREKNHKKLKRYYRKVARRQRVRSFAKILYYRRKYIKAWDLQPPTKEELYEVLDTPEKAFAYVATFIAVEKNEHQSRYPTPIKAMIENGRGNDKGVVFFLSDLLSRHGYRTYVTWVGYRGGGLLPMCAVVCKQITFTLGHVFKVHIGDQFDIMRDYYPDGNRWIILDKAASRIMMSYAEGRKEYGYPEIMIYDPAYWKGQSPTIYNIMKKMKIVEDGVRGEAKV